jgi:hypothetical protein
MPNSPHRFSVVIHDSTDAASLAAASSRQIEELHGKEDPNIGSSRRVKASSLRKPSRQYKQDEDAFDRFCTSMEGFVCRDHGSIQHSEETPVVIKKEKNVYVISSPPRVSSPPTTEDRDALDSLFEGIEGMTCRGGNNIRDETQTTKSRSKNMVSDRDKMTSEQHGDILDQTFEKIEHFICRDDAAVQNFSQAPANLEERTKQAHSIKQRESKKSTVRSSETTNSSPQEFETDLLSFAVGSICNGVEQIVCRDELLNASTEPDLLDHIFEPQCTSGNDDDSIMASESFVVTHPTQQKTKLMRKHNKDDRDILDRIFENIEAHTCGPDDDEPTIAAAQAPPPSEEKLLKPSRPKEEYSPKKQKKCSKETWAKFRVFKK